MRATDRIADPDLRIERITALPVDLGDLITLSLRDDFRALQRMREDWVSGSNRFDRPGEALFEARVGSRLIGLGGLNRDPYMQAPKVGRVRHLYVHPDFRRRGVGRLLVSKIVECASRSFVRVRLRTSGADADRFYVAIGFRRVVDEPKATHEMLPDRWGRFLIRRGKP